jgi:hypothetical protein
MTTTTTSKTAKDFTSSLDDAADRVLALNEKLIDTAKKTGNASIDAYEKAVTHLVEVQQQVAGATQLDWLNSLVKVQTGFVTEITTAYTSAAREALK